MKTVRVQEIQYC